MNKPNRNGQGMEFLNYTLFTCMFEDEKNDAFRKLVLVQTPIVETLYISDLDLGTNAFLRVPNCRITSSYDLLKKNNFKSYTAYEDESKSALLAIARFPIHSNSPASEDLAKKIDFAQMCFEDQIWRKPSKK